MSFAFRGELQLQMRGPSAAEAVNVVAAGTGGMASAIIILIIDVAGRQRFQTIGADKNSDDDDGEDESTGGTSRIFGEYV